MTRGELARLGLVVALGIATACSGEGAARAAPSSTAGASATTGARPSSSRPTVGSTTTSSSGSSSLPPPALGAGPAWPLDFPDPFILAVGDEHVAAATTSGRIQLQGLRSAGLADWAGPFELLGETPSWAAPLSTWAPALLRVSDGFVLYYTALVAGTDQHCISVAWAPTVASPFHEVHDAPLVCPTDAGGAIDPSPFRDDDGQLYLLWKNDGITLRRESAIWSQRLSDDGRQLLSDPVRLIGTDQDWEYPHVEAPSMAAIGGVYWLAYSGNWWNQPAYGVGMARCTSPSGPCEKPMTGPVLATTPGRFGPGGAEFFRDRSGRLLLAYHAWLDEPGYPGNRALFIAAVDLRADSVTVTPA